jgi:ribonuclease PH
MSRTDRSPLLPRPLTITPNFLPHLPGSALICTGNTRVICAASFDKKVPAWLAGKGRGWLSAEYSLMPGSTVPRARRERSGKISGRTQEIQRLIGRSLRAAIDLDALGERMIWLDCDVLEADGGTRTAAITGAYVAMALAIRRLERDGELAVGALKDPVAAISVGVVNGDVLVDLNYIEDSNADVDMNVVMMKNGTLIEVQGTGEKTSFSRTQLNALLDGAEAAAENLFESQAAAIESGLKLA